MLSILLLLAISWPKAGHSQWYEPKRIKFGMSGGFGGLHEWGKPSFDIHWHKTTLRLAPGVFYLSAGVTQQIGYFFPKRRKDRIIIISAYYHNDYFLIDLLRKGEIKKDQNIFMVMPGLRINLNYRGTVFFETSAGIMYNWERNFPPEKDAMFVKHHVWPMGEIRFGGIFLSRKEHHQKFPRKKKVNRIKRKKLK